MRTTLILPAGLHKRVRTMYEQILSVLLQSAQVPVVLQGVRMSKRCALTGAAVLRAREVASSAVFTTLFMPHATMTLFGPKVIAATRLPIPSTLTISPSSEIAFAPVKYVSHKRALRVISIFSSCDCAVLRSMTRHPPFFTRSMTPLCCLPHTIRV